MAYNTKNTMKNIKKLKKISNLETLKIRFKNRTKKTVVADSVNVLLIF